MPVNQKGERILDKKINCLTIITNESYENFAQTLQKEIEEDFGISAQGFVKNKRNKKVATLKKTFEQDWRFKAIWEKINHHTFYQICFSNKSQLIAKVALAISRMPKIQQPKIRSDKVAIKWEKNEMFTTKLSDSDEQINWNKLNFYLPDIFNFLQKSVSLTRSTIYEILKKI